MTALVIYLLVLMRSKRVSVCAFIGPPDHTRQMFLCQTEALERMTSRTSSTVTLCRKLSYLHRAHKRGERCPTSFHFFSTMMYRISFILPWVSVRSEKNKQECCGLPPNGQLGLPASHCAGVKA